MKSRVVNTKHFKLLEDEKKFVCCTNDLKPSLFNTNKKISRDESYLWIQSKVTNKMSKWVVQNEICKELNGIKHYYTIYIPEQKWITKFPDIEGYTLEIEWANNYLKFRNKKG